MRRFGTLATTLLVLLIRRTAGGGGTLPVAVLLKPQAKRCIHQVRGRIFVSQQRTRRRRLIYILYKYTAPVDLLYYCSHPPTHPPTTVRSILSILILIPQNFPQEVPAGSEGTVELFVESGGKLEVHLTIEGPLEKGWGNVPEETSKTETLLDEIVSNGHMSEEDGVEDFEDSFLYSFSTPESGGDNGDVYRACVCNDANHLMSKSVQIDFRAHGPRSSGRGSGEGGSGTKLGRMGSRAGKGGGDPIRLVSNPAQLSPEEQKKESARQEEVANLEASIKRLKSGLRKVQQQQQQERHRQAVHAAVNEDSNNHMVVGSLIETVVFVGTAIFQIMFVRHWFEGRGAHGGKGAGQWA